ncbi:hypothetical protein SAMN05216275_102318 [Streptosporangium canum]|uniref:GAF domain-containing protein n=1 Tax=Streptosporangium canum TaxID=324952 RepID=A0A1I3H1K6_9ACTN|nr:hypothetical protein [Streptosporangium canum]SFI29635.1 hypothetical protein SAMN05216275_102318 [Streptosporangium canum]
MSASTGNGRRPPAPQSGPAADTPGATPSGTERMLTGLLTQSHLMALEQIPAWAGRYAGHAGLQEVLIYLADLQQNVLRLLTGPGAPGTPDHPQQLRIDTTLAGRAFQEVRILAKQDAGEDAQWWWVPLLDGTERLGVLRVRAPGAGERTGDAMRHLASLLALLMVSKRPYSDTKDRSSDWRDLRTSSSAVPPTACRYPRHCAAWCTACRTTTTATYRTTPPCC